MFLIVDLIIVSIIALCVIIGYRRGLAGCIIKIVSFFLALIVAAILFKPVANMVVNNTQMDENLKTSIDVLRFSSICVLLTTILATGLNNIAATINARKNETILIIHPANPLL